MGTDLQDDFGGTEKHDINEVERAGSHSVGVPVNYNYVPGTPEEARLVRKIDLRLIVSRHARTVCFETVV